MLLIATALGLIGSVVLGLRGLGAGSAGELDRVLAIVFLFMAAGGALGSWLDDGRHQAHPTVVTGGFQLIVGAPLVLLMIVVFLATLIPAIYVMIPVFAAWYLGSRPRPPSRPEMHAPAPAYAH